MKKDLAGSLREAGRVALGTGEGGSDFASENWIFLRELTPAFADRGRLLLVCRDQCDRCALWLGDKQSSRKQVLPLVLEFKLANANVTPCRADIPHRVHSPFTLWRSWGQLRRLVKDVFHYNEAPCQILFPPDATTAPSRLFHVVITSVFTTCVPEPDVTRTPADRAMAYNVAARTT